MKYTPFTDLELYEVFVLAYPEKFGGEETNELWDEVLDFADSLSGIDEIMDLLGRVVMLTMPLRGKTFDDNDTGTLFHALGELFPPVDGKMDLFSVVNREVIPENFKKRG